MPYIKQDAAGRILSLHREAEPGADTYLPASHPDVLAFMGQEGNAMEKMDLEFIRVIEDVIDLLLERNVIMFTDLPPAVQQKLNLRRSTRSSGQGEDPFDGDVVHLP
ncbi:hypothetical protein [Azovibrio restrictus]|uniref:hypothetical protein n=1 Tax=Azovibrio restrictus TaxID=146938 RepID=UPI0026E9AE35|nr:hypothetical protein [Azovibrio restrictus]MDD3484008.1 hypothetical protein [Azovibrio restrictus]